MRICLGYEEDEQEEVFLSSHASCNFYFFLYSLKNRGMVLPNLKVWLLFK